MFKTTVCAIAIAALTVSPTVRADILLCGYLGSADSVMIDGEEVITVTDQRYCQQDGGTGGTGPGDTSGGDGYGDGPWGPDGDPSEDDIQHYQNCQKCAAEVAECDRYAADSLTSCQGRGAQQARVLCDTAGTQSRPPRATTPWNRNLEEMLGGFKTGEELWDLPRRWSYQCGYPTGVRSPTNYTCSGNAFESCEAAWAASHPATSTTVRDSASFTFKWDPIGVGAGGEITSTYSFSARSGWREACSSMYIDLAASCTAGLRVCAAANKCTAEDMQ